MSGHQPARSNVTILDVAREAGVSYSTVSRVVNNFQFVKPATRERVQAAMVKLGYVANVKARSLAGGRSQMLGLLLYDFESSYQVEIVRGIDAEVSELDYDLMLYTTHHRRQKESTLVAKLTQGLVDGLLIVLPRNLEAYLEDLDSRQFPYVLIDHAVTGSSSNTVKAQNWQGSHQAVSHLVELGHRRIGFVEGVNTVISARERLEGYHKALADHGLPLDKTLIRSGDFTWESGFEAARQYLALDHPPTAVIAASDVCAFGVIEGLLSNNVRVPDDISVMGFDDIPESKTGRPSLTTMRQDLRQMGRIATRKLVQYIDHPEQTNENIELPMALIKRESTASPAGSRFHS